MSPNYSNHESICRTCRQSPHLYPWPPRQFSPGEAILIADPFLSIRELMRDLLECSGYSVLGAACSIDALRLANEHPGPIPLIITDIILPGSNGFLLAEHVRAKRPEARVLYAGASQDSFRFPYHLGGDFALIEKPFRKHDFLRQVSGLLQ